MALLNSHYNGGYLFDKYEWYINGRKVDYANGTNLYSQELGIGDEVVLYPQRVGDAYSIPTCPIYIYDKSREWQNETPIFVYPTAVPQSNPKVHIKTNSKGDCTLYSIYGTIIQKVVGVNGEITIDVPNHRGWYILHYTSKQSEGIITKICVY